MRTIKHNMVEYDEGITPGNVSDYIRQKTKDVRNKIEFYWGKKGWESISVVWGLNVNAVEIHDDRIGVGEEDFKEGDLYMGCKHYKAK